LDEERVVTADIEITGIRVRPLVVPLKRGLATSFGLFKEGPFVAIDLDTKGGIPGRVLGFTFHKLGLKLVPPALEALAAFAKGKTITFAEMPAFHDACQKSLMLLGHEGVTQMALSMFDMAIHDALARAAGVPLWKLLGGRPDPIPAYNSCGLGILAPEAAAKEARELVAEHGGFRHVKMRLGRGDVAAEIAAIRAVSSAAGDGVLVSSDFNQALAPATALDTCRAIDDLGLAWIEEPVVFDDYETQARLTAKLKTPVQIGETWWHWRVGKRAIEMGAADYIMPDILRIGGVTGWMRLARVAEAAAIPFSSHLSPEYSAHVLAATPTRHWLEFMDWGQELIRDPVVPDKGFARPKDTPGAGIDWNEAAVGRRVVSV
jgi:mandelate racemase